MIDFAKALVMKKNRNNKKVKRKPGRPKTADSGKLLSDREEEILGELKAGRTYEQIADLLCISLATVKTHANKIYKKLEVKNRTQAVNKFFEKK